MRIRLEVTLDDDGDEASATAILEVIDPHGVVLQSRTGAVSFVRIPFEPLE
jgi:acetolactate synthase small subunit